MKILSILLFFALLSACAGEKNMPGTSGETKAQGGVDVGNMSSSAVPNTNVYFTFPTNWKYKIENNLLVIENKSFSKIEAAKVELVGLKSLKIEDLEAYVKEKHSDRTYQIIDINGNPGVRAELTNTDQERISDIFLISEAKQIIHIVTNFNSEDEGFDEGEKIISNIKVKYSGFHVTDATVRVAELPDQKENRSYTYSLTSNRWVNEDSTGSTFSLNNNRFHVKGNIVELGEVDDIPFDSIKVEGEFLVAPDSNFPISDIYADDRGQSFLTLKDGFVYLIRIDDGPEEGLIIKMSVTGESLSNDLKLTYQKLVAVKPDAKP